MQYCSRRARLRWLLMSGVWLLALLPAFLLDFSLPPEAQGVTLAWWTSLTASKYGLPVVGLLLILLLRVPRRELPLLVLPALLFIGLGAAVNEHLLKPLLKEPRPDIEWLATASAGPVLPEGVDGFYAMPGKEPRSERLAAGLEQNRLDLPPLLAEHWVEETGFSFPSGHAFAAASLAGWFMLWALCRRRNRWLPPLLVAWGVAVCWSRLVLGVHRPEDVLAGSLQGLALALLAGALVQGWLKRQAPGRRTPAPKG